MLDWVRMGTDERVTTTMEAPIHSEPSPAPPSWSNRILTLAVAAILLLTLYPFWFDFAQHLPRALFPFSLGGWGKNLSRVDDFLNVLLFVPYGFGLAERLRERGKSRLLALGLTLASGALLSYTVELLQIYIPSRDSGWEDVATNSFGAAAGALLFDLCGGAALRLLSATERSVSAWLTWRRALVALLFYIGLWSAIAVRLQHEARLSDWNSDSVLVIGKASNRFSSAWKGQVFALEIWDHAVSPEFARRVTAERPMDAPAPDSVIAYRFLGSAPFQDERRFLPDLSWTPQAPVSADPTRAFLDGKSWLISPGPVPALVNDLKKTGQLSIQVVCEPAEIGGVDAQIISISSPSGAVNMELGQAAASLVFWFRTPLSMHRSRMSWVIPETFAANESRNILFTFDSAHLNAFIDGKEQSRAYELGPGASLARFVRRIKMRELKGYKYVFYALVFIPAGCVLGCAWRTVTRHWIGLLSLLLLGLALPPLIFEVVLVQASGRAMSSQNLWLSILLTASGSIWINADRGSPGTPRGQDQLSSAG
jgi:VanZ family protein